MSLEQGPDKCASDVASTSVTLDLTTAPHVEQLPLLHFAVQQDLSLGAGMTREMALVHPFFQICLPPGKGSIAYTLYHWNDPQKTPLLVFSREPRAHWREPVQCICYRDHHLFASLQHALAQDSSPTHVLSREESYTLLHHYFTQKRHVEASSPKWTRSMEEQGIVEAYQGIIYDLHFLRESVYQRALYAIVREPVWSSQHDVRGIPFWRMWITYRATRRQFLAYLDGSTAMPSPQIVSFADLIRRGFVPW